MAYDLNSVQLVGELIGSPYIHTTRQGTEILLGRLQVVERFQLADGRQASHTNDIAFEVVGKIDRYLDLLKPGKRYHLNGYLRVDVLKGEQKTRVRCFSIQKAD
jgi:single-stranded DNA-binding protein